MSNTPKFTIVIAGYQTAPYLPKALDSISSQTFGDFEAICYVEQSNDDSHTICRAKAAGDPRFKVVSARKSGAVATTRNYAIDHAAGEYLVVIDGDDWIVPDMLGKIASRLAQTGPIDVLAFAAVTTESENEYLDGAQRLTNFKPTDTEGVFSGLEAIRRAGRNGGQLRNFTWMNTYRVAFLRENDIHQTDGVLMEDMESTPRIWFAAKTFAYLDETLYVYRRRPGSLTTEASGRIAIDITWQFRSLADFTATHDVPSDIKAIWSNQWLSTLYWFLFHPITSRKVSNADRKEAFRVISMNGGRSRLREISRLASFPKRLALPLVLLATCGWQFPAKMFFRRLYYPLVERRAQD